MSCFACRNGQEIYCTCKTAEDRRSECSDLLCGLNGDNKLFIAVTCKYDVSPDEWEELVALINRAIDDHDDGKFRNIVATINPAT